MSLKRFLLSAFAGLFAVLNLHAADDASRQYFEIRVYSTVSAVQRSLINDYWEKAAIPAYNRAGVGPVGVFTDVNEATNSKVYVLVTYPDAVTYSTLPATLAADSAYQKAGEEYLNTPRSSPAYVRFESSLLVAFDGMKKISPPPSAADKRPWIFELRTYESHSESRGNNKVAMFNAGEIPLMKDVGLSPVFFAQTLVGTQMPNMVYMVSGESMEEHKKHWGAFGSSEVWKRLSSDSQYKDNVSRISNVFLKRMSASQL
jgi:NIPSNAP